MDNFQIYRIIGYSVLVAIVCIAAWGIATTKLPDEDIKPHTDSYHKEG